MKSRSRGRVYTILSVSAILISSLGLIVVLAAWLGVGSELTWTLFTAVLSLLIGFYSSSFTDLIRKRVLRAPNVFLSYSHRETATAKEVVEILRQAGTKVWVDFEHLKPGQNISQELERAISDSDAFVAVLSDSTEPWAARELEIAKEKGVKIVPVLLKGAKVPKIIDDVYYIDYSTPGQETTDKLIKAVKSA